MSARGGSPQVTFRMGPVGDELLARADGTGSPAWVAKRDLIRYYRVLEEGREEVRALHLERGEAVLLLDRLNAGRGNLRARILFGGWGPTLTGKLERLSAAGSFALLDAVERARSAADPIARILQECGVAGGDSSPPASTTS